MAASLYLAATLCGAAVCGWLLWLRAGPRAIAVVVPALVLGSYGGVLLEPVLFGHGSIGFLTAARSLLASPLRAPATILGCLVGGIGGVALGAAAVRVPFLTALDCAFVSVSVGQVVGRLGCFVNGCCLGRPTTFFLGMRPPPASAAALLVGPIPLHPVQLYEAAAVAGVLLVLILRRERIGDGFATGFYLLSFGAIRFALQYLRLDGPTGLTDVNRAQLAAIALCLVGCGVLLLTRAGTRVR